MTLNQLASELIQEQSEKIGDTAYLTQLEKWAKDAITEISVRTKFKFFWKDHTITTVVGTSSYDLPKEFRDFKFVRHTDNDDEIDYINPRRLVNFGLDLERQERPRYWWISDATVDATDLIQKVRFNPTPNAIFSINAPFYFHPVNLISGSVLPVTEEAILVIKSRVRMQVYKNDSRLDLFNIERGQFSSDLSNLITQERTISARTLVNQQTDLPRRTGRPYRLRYPFE